MPICKDCIHNEVCKYGENRSNGMYCTGEKCKQYQSTADVVKQDVFKMMVENAMAIPKLMHLYIYFADEHIEKHIVTRFTDLSQTKSQFYYYEELHHESGKGKTFRRDEIKCFEVSFCPLQNWEQYLAVKE